MINVGLKLESLFCKHGLQSLYIRLTSSNLHTIFVQLLKVPTNFWLGAGARLPPVCAIPRVLPSQRGYLVLSPSLALVTAPHRSSRRILLYIMDYWECGKIAESTGDPQ